MATWAYTCFEALSKMMLLLMMMMNITVVIILVFNKWDEVNPLVMAPLVCSIDFINYQVSVMLRVWHGAT